MQSRGYHVRGLRKFPYGAEGRGKWQRNNSILQTVGAKYMHQLPAWTAIPSSTFSGGQLVLFRLNSVLGRSACLLVTSVPCPLQK